MLRFSLFGFPVAIHWLFWVNMGLLSGGIEASSPEELRRVVLWVVAAFASVLIHELGHTFVMRGCGARASILLYGFGGLAIPDRNFPRGQSIVVSLAGPLVEIACGLIAYQFLKSLAHAESLGDVQHVMHLRGVPYTFIFLWNFVFISVFWGAINLVPVYPLDGGQVFANVVGPRNMGLAFIVSIVCAAAVAVWMFSRGSIFATIFFGMMAFENLQRLRGGRPSSFFRPS